MAQTNEVLRIPGCPSEYSISFRLAHEKISVREIPSFQYGGLLIPVTMANLPKEIKFVKDELPEQGTTSNVWKIDGLLDVIKVQE